MKPWGCQVRFYIFSSGLLGNRERLAGGLGGAAMSPPGRRTTRRNLRHGCLPGHLFNSDALGMHSTMRAAAPCWTNPVPAQKSRYAASPIRSDILR